MISENNSDPELNMSFQYQNLSIYDNNLAVTIKNANSNPHIDERALRMMEKMGYKPGSGLGKSEQGITKVVDISYQLGKKGLGLKLKNIEDTLETWDFGSEEVNAKENLLWLHNNDPSNFSLKEMLLWIREGPPICDVKSETHFCNEEILHKVVKAKDIFDEMDITELCYARTKSNPFETIRSAFFMNRAALKIANIDAVTNFMFTNIDKNEYFKNQKGPFYFADVCAGPGGFSEYVLWRRQWLFKGFGLTLKDEKDFKIQESCCACPATFQALYGKDDDGNVCSPENIIDFKEKVFHETEGEGVHFMMSDGGFSVEGNENFQEILSKAFTFANVLLLSKLLDPTDIFLARRQTIGLKKLATFCRNPTIVEFRQEELRKKCLDFWKIPNKPKTPLPQLTAVQLVNTVLDKPEIILVQPRKIDQMNAFNETISNIEDWYYCPLYSSQKTNNCNFYAGVTSKVFRLQNRKWVRVKNIQLSRGTLVYGEFVKEKCVTKSEDGEDLENIIYSLHIIDALQLGEQNLSDLSFSERQEVIKVYCKALNKESQPDFVRIRPKIMDKLLNISLDCLICQGEEGIYSNLPLLGYKSISESFSVNSMLLLKINSSQSFHWSYVLRVQIFLKNNEDNEMTLLLEDILSEIKQRS